MIKWTNFKHEYPSNNVTHVLVYTPNSSPQLEHRIMPIYIAIKKNQEFTHWAYLSKPERNTHTGER